MTKVKEAPKTEASVEEKLRALYKLQKVDSKIDEIQILKGELPMEVKDLEDELAGLRNASIIAGRVRRVRRRRRARGDRTR